MQLSHSTPTPRFRRWLIVLIVVNIMLLAVVAALLLLQTTSGVKSEPRTVTPRGDLAADEWATIELFRKARGSVVFISTRQRS